MINALAKTKPEGLGSNLPRARVRLSLGLAFSSILLVAGASPFLGPLGENFHLVIPGCVYRSGQLSPESLEDRATRNGIRSVINLRGANPGDDWYEMERAAARHQGLKLYDLPVDSQCPTAGELKELLEVLQRCPKPVLVHCQSGIDRSGIVAAICILLLDESGTVEQAETQLGWRYGHMPWCDNVGVQERFFRDYECWLAVHAQSHNLARFRDWLLSISEQGLARNASPANK
jgi:protein tyrosine phosphatase (PTP) superfamily phosphohydrolase (DUF442 family)